MHVDFLRLLVILTIASGLIVLVDNLFWSKDRKLAHAVKQRPWLVEQAHGFLPIFLIVLLVRAFIVQPYRVPTGSLLPTVIPGDFLAVSQFSYGLRLPVWHYKILGQGKPYRGDIVVFRWPVNPNIDYVKRIVGIPGDRISYIDKQLTINGKVATQTFIDYATDGNPNNHWTVKHLQEDLAGVKHEIYIRPDTVSENFQDLLIPAGNYLVMGDNRDNSDDGRFWGFVPEEALIGKAKLIWFSWNSDTWGVRWHHIGKFL